MAIIYHEWDENFVTLELDRPVMHRTVEAISKLTGFFFDLDPTRLLHRVRIRFPIGDSKIEPFINTYGPVTQVITSNPSLPTYQEVGERID